MLICGKNASREVLTSPNKITKVYLNDNFNNKELLNLINKKKLRTIYLKQNEMDKLTNEVHQGIILEIEDIKYLDFNSIKEDLSSNFIVILDHLEDPRNFGAIIRTCECAGVNYIIIPNKRSVEITPSVLKTSAGALINTKIVMVSNLNNTIKSLKELNYWIIGTDSNGTDYRQIDYNGKIALVIGSEGFGMKEMVKRNCDVIASIPLHGKVNSLNASVAAAILIYEVIRGK